jgi:hypothetical protein
VPVPPRSAPPPEPKFAATPDPLAPTVASSEGAAPPRSYEPLPMDELPPPASGVLAADFKPRAELELHPLAVRWTALVCFAILFFLMVFPWIASPLSGKHAFEQSGYGVAFGSQSPKPADAKDGVGTAPFVILYFLVILVGFLAGLGLVVIHVVLPRLGEPVPLPIQQLLPHRTLIIGGLALFAFLFLSVQFLWGFPATGHAFPADPELMRALLYKTLWLRLTYALTVIALLAALGDFWLERRGKRPLPRLTLEW